MSVRAGTPYPPAVEEVRRVVAGVPDPELPVLTIEDLGVLRDVEVDADGRVRVDITPTYSGCPAIDAIRADIHARLAERGWQDAEVRVVLSPAWSSDDITATGRHRLAEYGIAPPGPASPRVDRAVLVPLSAPVRCPQCGSARTREVSRFGSTACKALWTCSDCLEPFDYVKPL